MLILKEVISSLVMSGCSVWCRLVGRIFSSFFLGSMVMYLWISHSISVSKFCGGGWRKLVRCRRLLWKKRFHSHFSL